jgi:calcium channel MID1
MHPLDQRNDTMRLEDTDTTNALLVTDQTMPNATVLITQGLPKELKYSYCAAKSYQVAGQSINTTTEAQRGQQFFMVANLTQEQTYQAYIIQHQTAQITSLTVPLALQTKSGKRMDATPLQETQLFFQIDPHCRLIHGLDFCSDVAYSVPSDPTQDIWNITRAYDKQAQDLFAPFATALSQFNCNNTQYSLVRNCDDCYRDYKRWLCAVTIPRCTSSSSPSTLVTTRTVAAQSARNPWIDATYSLQNGWTELLPCVDVCYQVVQSCPPFLQFNCPEGDLAAQQYGYWKTIVNDSLVLDVNNPTCNRVGMNVSLLVISAGSTLMSSSWLVVTASLAATLVAIDAFN